MYKILALNKISKSGLCELPEEDFNVVLEENNPDGIILRSFSMHEMELPESLKAVARAGAGVNNIPIDKCSEKGIVVFNTPGANANAVKELVIAGLFLSSRKIHEGINWAQSLAGQEGVAKLIEKGKGQFVGPEIAGKKLGVVGLGAIGILVANACVGLGMQVIGYDPYLSVDNALKLSPGVNKTASIDEIYEQCDYITIHVPLIADTKYMFNDTVFEKIKKGVAILNFSRGELVDNASIKKAIANGIVSKYIIDFPNEDLLGIENIITIPHLGASTPESEDNCASMAAIQLKQFLSFGNIKNSVNFPECELAYTGKKRICLAHKNLPEIISTIPTTITDAKLSIENMVSKSRGGNGYTIVDVSQNEIGSVVDELSKIQGVIRVIVI